MSPSTAMAALTGATGELPGWTSSHPVVVFRVLVENVFLWVIR